MRFTTVGPGHKYTLYVDDFAGGSLNGNQFIATNLAPNQVEINLTQSVSLSVNGTATLNGVVNCNSASTASLLGTFTMYGAIRCNTISANGAATLGYDEGIGVGGVLSDIQFSLYKASQRYQ